MRKVILIVLDSVGIGAAPDAEQYHDNESNTLGHIIEQMPDFKLDHLQSLGLSRIDGVNGLDLTPLRAGCFYGRLQEISRGKDTVTGHWEMTGIVTKQLFPTYPKGFPLEMVTAFEQAAGVKVIGNEVASGTEIIARLGQNHLACGYPILYTSADSVWQMAAHETVVPLEQLYHYCEIARELFKTPPNNIGRIIARPFIGENGNFTRTANRRDYALAPNKNNLLCDLVAQEQQVIAVGKINDIFAQQGITKAIHIESNQDGIEQTINAYRQLENGLIFTNLVDFDAKYGHRRDVMGYAQALMDFDEGLSELLNRLDKDTLLLITADHGCDPTFRGTDHTREYVPLVGLCPNSKKCYNLGTRVGFGDIGASIAAFLGINYSGEGQSFYAVLEEK